jgi:hypothetical protein
LYPALIGIDFVRLKQRAQEYHDRVEQHRLETAYAAFAGVAPVGGHELGRRRA